MGKSQKKFLQVRVREEKRGCRERSSDFSLRSTELGWSSRIEPRLESRSTR